jgi:Na+-translocating ferredoxin:NAD+ oxidoreductase subunit A
MGLLSIFMSAMIINNIFLIQFLGMSSYFKDSHKMESVINMSIVVVVMTVLAAVMIYPLNRFVLEPLGLSYMQLLVFMGVIAFAVFLFNLIIKRLPQYQSFKKLLPLIISNSAVLGIAFINIEASKSYIEAIIFALGSGLGYGLIIITFTAIRMRLESYQVPQAFKGLPIALITAGLMSLAFLGLVGLF